VGANGTLWLLPPAGADPRASGAVAEVSVAPHALSLDGAQNVSFAHLSVATAQSTVVSASGVTGVTLDALQVSRHAPMHRCDMVA